MAYDRVNWQNQPSTATPINAENLNRMDKGIATLNNNFTDKTNKNYNIKLKTINNRPYITFKEV